MPAIHLREALREVDGRVQALVEMERGHRLFKPLGKNASPVYFIKGEEFGQQV